MKNLKAILAIALFFGLIPLASEAQNYQTAAGLRLGYPLSVSIKHFIDDSAALEGYVGTRWYDNRSWTSVSGAYQQHFDLEGVDGLQWYVGAGGTVYFWRYDFKTTAAATAFGLQGYLGLDYTFDDAPISITADWIPTIFLNGYIKGFGGGYGSLGIRYLLAR